MGNKKEMKRETMSKKTTKHVKKETNYLEKIPKKPEHISWTKDDNGIVTISYENKGIFNRIAQKLFHKPKISYVHFDKFGSFVWPLIDGKKDILALGKDVEAEFGEEEHPLYERLAKFFQIMSSYGFVDWMK